MYICQAYKPAYEGEMALGGSIERGSSSPILAQIFNHAKSLGLRVLVRHPNGTDYIVSGDRGKCLKTRIKRIITRPLNQPRKTNVGQLTQREIDAGTAARNRALITNNRNALRHELMESANARAEAVIAAVREAGAHISPGTLLDAAVQPAAEAAAEAAVAATAASAAAAVVQSAATAATAANDAIAAAAAENNNITSRFAAAMTEGGMPESKQDGQEEEEGKGYFSRIKKSFQNIWRS